MGGMDEKNSYSMAAPVVDFGCGMCYAGFTGVYFALCFLLLSSAGHSSSQHMDTRLSALAVLAAMKGSLLQFCSIFRPPSTWTLRPSVAGTPGV